jgi:cephalosporin hydroxylase
MKTPQEVVNDFHKLWYYSPWCVGWRNTHWLGVRAEKCPFDLWQYQEIIVEQRPDLIIETGTFHGGSALYMATICDLIKHGRIVTIDIHPQPGRPAHERITYLLGSSTAPEIVAQVKAGIGTGERVMVILDSDHRKPHVLAELKTYAPLVSPGSYLIVEDSNINGHPVLPQFGPGPMEALQEFLPENPHFQHDTSRDKLLLTFNPRGWLKRMG